MPRLKWTAEAIADVSRLRAFLAEKDVALSRRAMAAIHAGLQILQTHPNIGRALDETGSYRERVVSFGHYAYVVLYRVDGQREIILHVRHGRESDY